MSPPHPVPGVGGDVRNIPAFASLTSGLIIGGSSGEGASNMIVTLPGETAPVAADHPAKTIWAEVYTP